ncbi:GNAT family protein [uncultured Methanomethylovorans sp.]|uniref:GNAT family N-acetyltransferase n=1 Tax=uncultured Methanomethylovorans sp. TaxID=183759 RepID=UPI002AA6BDDE|nr:GNAT family protein [uncultured Methanomethylovorans sp.]
MLKGCYVGLRAIERADLPQLLEFRNRPEFRRYFREYRELSMENQNNWYEKMVMNDPKTIMFSIIELENNRLLGACGLCYIDWINKNADFSIYIGVDDLYLDDKFGPDAGSIMARYGFEELGLHRLWAEIYSFDETKKIFFDKIGFKLEGIHRETHWSEGKWHDSLFYSLLNTEYLS